MYHQLDVLLRNREIGGSSKEAVEAASLWKLDWPIVNVQNCENEVEMTKKKTKDPSHLFYDYMYKQNNLRRNRRRKWKGCRCDDELLRFCVSG